jgi:hypothetical protein
MKNNPDAAKTKLPHALEEVDKIKSETKRQDVIELADSASALLHGMSMRGSYSSVYAGVIDTLKRKAGATVAEETADEITALREEVKGLKAKLAAGQSGDDE